MKDLARAGKELRDLGRTPEERMAALPAPLRLSAEQLAEAARENRKVLAEANHPFARLSPRQRERVAGLRAAKEWEAALQQVEMALRNRRRYKRRGQMRSEELRRLRQNARDHLAEAYAAQGRFDLAAAYADDPTRRAELERLWAAVMRPDDEVCGEECRRAFDDDPTTLTFETVHADVWSVKHGREMSAVRCYCGALNVRPLPEEIGRQRAARSQARSLAEGRSPAEASAVLAEAGLTSKEVFKA